MSSHEATVETKVDVEPTPVAAVVPVDEFVFKAKPDIYSGLTIDVNDLPKDKDEFEARLSHSLEVWKMDGKRGIWLVIPIENSAFIPVAVSLGFVFHHTTPAAITLTTWLSSEPNKLPQYSPVTIGVGGLVVDEATDSVLLVQEKFSHFKDSWKLPGGLVDEGEDLFTAVEREVLEETGVEAEAYGVVGFSHFFPYLNDCSNFYFVILMRPKTTAINMQVSEIAKCEWINAPSFLENGSTTKFTRAIISIGYESYKAAKALSKETNSSSSSSSSSSESQEADQQPVVLKIETDDPSNVSVFYRFEVAFRIPQTKQAYFQFYKPGPRAYPGLAAL